MIQNNLFGVIFMLFALCSSIFNLLIRATVTAASFQIQAFEEKISYNWILVLVISILVFAGLFAFIIYRGVPQRFHGIAAIKALFNGKNGIDDDSLNNAIEAAGYSYDPLQDIFYSNMDPWQKDHGYCRLYDEAAAPWGMIIDCEPITFEYEGKRWLIEFWKGQYDMTTGAEIGIYTTEGPDLNIPGIFNGTFYHSASDEDRLEMAFVLKKNGKTLFSRRGRHWWLTGFKLGEYSEPWELTLILTITLKDKKMLSAFIDGLKNAGYSEKEIVINGFNVSLKFKEPRTPQPFTRTRETDKLIQKKNKLLCDKYQEITAGYNKFPDKLKALQQKAPDIYEMLGKVGKPKGIYDKYEKIKSYID